MDCALRGREEGTGEEEGEDGGNEG